MRYLLDGSQARAVDSYNIKELGIPSLALMERAALAVFQEAERRTEPGSRVLAVCGMGNNGADGLAAARMLKQRGRDVEVVLCGNPENATEEHEIQLAIVKKLGISVRTADNEAGYPIKEGCFSLIIDALFGVGLKRPLAGSFAAAVKAMNESGVPILAVDIPSGISAASGQVLGGAVRASATVTFGYEKLGWCCIPDRITAGTRPWRTSVFPRPAGFRRARPEPLDRDPAEAACAACGRKQGDFRESACVRGKLRHVRCGLSERAGGLPHGSGAGADLYRAGKCTGASDHAAGSDRDRLRPDGARREPG